MSRRLRGCSPWVLGLLMLAGCGFRGAYSFNLPGGADTGNNPYKVKIQFLDVLDLVPAVRGPRRRRAGRPRRGHRARQGLDRRR